MANLARISARASEETRTMIRALGKRHGLTTEESYGAALEFAESHQEQFEQFVVEQQAGGPNDDT